MRIPALFACLYLPIWFCSHCTADIVYSVDYLVDETQLNGTITVDAFGDITSENSILDWNIVFSNTNGAFADVVADDANSAFHIFEAKVIATETGLFWQVTRPPANTSGHSFVELRRGTVGTPPNGPAVAQLKLESQNALQGDGSYLLTERLFARHKPDGVSGNLDFGVYTSTIKIADFESNSVPEPASSVLFCAALIGRIVHRGRRKCA